MSQAKTVAIIGAGPVGLAAAAHVLEREDDLGVLAADVHRAVPQRSDFQACSPQETPAQHDRHARGALSPRRPGRRAPVTGSLESVNRSRAARGRHERQSRLSVRLVPSRHGSLVDV